MTSRRPRHPRSIQTLSRVAMACAFVGALVAGSAAGCGGNDGVVGGDCAGGYTQCNLSCLNLQTNPSNCGACGNACLTGVACTGGVCANERLDGAPDGFDYDGSDILIDGQICNVTDPAHPICRPEFPPDGSDAGDAADAKNDATLDGGSDGNGGGSDGSADGTVSGDAGKDGSGGNGDGSTNSDGSMSSDDGSMSNDDGSMSNEDGSVNEDGSSPDACTPPFDTPASCGTCGNVCVAPNNVCELVDGGFQCAPTCAPPLVACNGSCVNLARDPVNCGMCGTTCASQYCFLATCQGSVAGNIMVIGHDFQKTLPTDEQALLLTNSVFYNSGAVNLLSFEHYGDAATVANGLSILKGFATAQHITLNVQSTSDDTAPSNDMLLASETVALFWDQPNAPTGTLGSLGSTWAPHLSKFVQGGGIVIVLDADQGVGEMPALLNNAALLAVTGHAAVTPGSPADVPLAGLAIARGMTSVYGVEQNTAWFSTSEPSSNKTLYVVNVQGDVNELVAVQKVIN